MNHKTKKLHSLMRRHGLTAPDVAEILGRKPHTVRVWRVARTTRVIPDDTLQLLTLKLAARGASGSAA